MILAATAYAYYPGLHGPFLFDDNSNIIANTALRNANFLSLQGLLQAAFSIRSGVLYRPLSMLSFAFNFHVFGDQSFSFKLTNLVIHLINALLILWLTRRLLLNCRRRYQFDWSDTCINWTSILLAGAWALHPLNLTAVLYIVQRMTSLAAFFSLAGILAYVYGRERMQSGKTAWPLIWLLTPVLGFVGILCKEDAALLPLYLVLIEWLVFSFRDKHDKVAKNIPPFFLCSLVLPGIVGLVFLAADPSWFLGGYVIRDFSLGERLLTEIRVVLLYIQWTFFPDIRELALFHDDIAVSTGLLHPVTTLLSLFALLAILVLAFWQRRKRPLLCLGILWFFAGQVIESSILPLELAFEHRNYLPDYGLLLSAFSLLLLPTVSSRRHVNMSLRWTIALLTIPTLFAVTHLRASEWNNYLDFTYYEAHHHPDSPRAVYSLGQMYAILAIQNNLKNPTQALNTLTHASSIGNTVMPDAAMMIMNSKLKRSVNPAWAEHANRILNTQPLFPQDVIAFNSLVDCLPTDCKNLAPSINTMFQAAFRTNNITAAHHTAADLWTVYTNFLTFTDAPLNQILVAMHKAANLAPNIPQYHINLAKGLIMSGDFNGAEEQIKLLLRLNLFGNLDVEIQSLNTSLSATRAAWNKSKSSHQKLTH